MVTVANLSQRPRVSIPAPCVAASVALACAFAAPAAAAQYSATQEYKTGFSLLRFEPAKAGDRFFGVPDASAPGNTSSRVRVLLLGDYVNAPILSRTSDQTGQTTHVISKQFITHLEAGYFPSDHLFLNAGIPLVLSQSGDSSTTPTGVAAGDTRLGARYGLVGSENAGFSLAPALDVWLPTGSQDKLTGDGKLRAQPMLTLSGRASDFVWSANIGYQLRRQLDNGSVEVGNSYAFGAAAGLLLFNDTVQIGPELYGAALSSPVHGSAFDSQNTVLEGVLGAKVHAGSFAFGVAAGPGLASAPGTAPRLLLSAAYAPQAPYSHQSATPPAPKPDSAAEPVSVAPPPAPPADRDGDGIVDADDACPDERGVAADDQSKNGCPAPPAPATTPAQLAPGEEDTDGDGIPDSEDACKRVQGVASDTPRLNGCPAPVDTDGDGVTDDNDACPKKAGVASTDPKRNGCPEIGAKALAAKRATANPRASAPATTTRVSTSAGGSAELTYSGFRSFDDGTSLVFIELTAPVTVNLKSKHGKGKAKGDNTFVYVLENTKVPLRNNRNPLNAVDFPSALRRATIVQKKKSVEVTLTLKVPVQPETQMVQRAGKTVLEIRLPKVDGASSSAR